MSNETTEQAVTRSNFASRLLEKGLSERKKTGEVSIVTLTTADAAQYAVPETEQKEQTASAGV